LQGTPRDLNTELFIARRIVSRSKGNFSRPVVMIAIAAIALGVTVMFVSIAILTGFQKEIREKVIGFGGHIQVSHFSENPSIESRPIGRDQPFLSQLRKTKGISHVQVYGIKAGIIRTADQIQGIVLKGIGSDFDWSFFGKRIVEGQPFTVTDTGKTDEVIVSRALARLLQLKVNDPLKVYFISGENTLGRKFRISGIYETGLEEFDKLFVIGDIHHIQKLNGWNADQVGGFEILIDNFNDIDRMGLTVYHMIGFSMDASTIKQMYPQIFDWLDLQDMNVLIILILMMVVSAITMISTLLILILERTVMIGILKSLGMTNRAIRNVFLYNAVYIIGIGMLLGNLLGFALCLLQLKTGLMTLPQESYYMPVVPIYLNPANIILLNVFTLGVCYLMMILPSFIVTRIRPIKAIRFS
jgi:lipoprotein-releasing system permease protein